MDLLGPVLESKRRYTGELFPIVGHDNHFFCSGLCRHKQIVGTDQVSCLFEYEAYISEAPSVILCKREYVDVPGQKSINNVPILSGVLAVLRTVVQLGNGYAAYPTLVCL